MIPWHLIPPDRLRRFEDLDGVDALALAGADQLAAFLRDLFGRYCLPIDTGHPHNVYAVLVTVDVVRELLHRVPWIDDESVEDAEDVLRQVELALAAYVPGDVRS